MNFHKYINARRLYRIIMIVCLIIMILLGVLTYYGQNSGNFVLTVDENAYRRGITLCETSDFRTENRWLTADPVEDVRDITLKQIPIKNILLQDGSYKGLGVKKRKYLAYTFYIKNIGEEVTDVRYYINITKEDKDISSAIRLMIFMDGYVVEDEWGNEEIKFATANIYEKNNGNDPVYYDELNDYTYFVDDKMICDSVISALEPTQFKKITVILWLEGEDPECTAELYGSNIKMTMNFEIMEGDIEE